MNILFGEVVEPDSRAFYEDYDDPEISVEGYIKLELKWKDESHNPKNVKTLLIFEGIDVEVLYSTFLKKEMLICYTSNLDVKIFEMKENNIVVCVTKHSNFDEYNKITELLEPWIRAESVVAFTFFSHTQFKGKKSNNPDCFIRGLNTETVDVLEEPNFISGVSAGVISRRLFLKFKPASSYAYIIYLTTTFPTSSTVTRILNILKLFKIPIADNFKNHIPYSNMYM